MSMWYDKNGTQIGGVEEFIEWLDTNFGGETQQFDEYRIVSRDTLSDGTTWIATDLLVVDHSFGMSDRPVIFESMVFAKDGTELDVRRYSTLLEAQEGHEALVQEWNSRLQGATELPRRIRFES